MIGTPHYFKGKQANIERSFSVGGPPLSDYAHLPKFDFDDWKTRIVHKMLENL